MTRPAIILGAALGLSLLFFVIEGEGGEEGEGPGLVDTLIDTFSEVTGMGWNPNKIPAQYREIIAQTEADNGLPANMLARLLWQESRYRPDIITGRTKSPAGALGIAQFMPATAAEMGIDPLDPYQAIPAAGQYLAGLFVRFGAWDKALAAYNWGQGNVARKGLARAPLETRNYFTGILSDLGLA